MVPGGTTPSAAAVSAKTASTACSTTGTDRKDTSSPTSSQIFSAPRLRSRNTACAVAKRAGSARWKLKLDRSEEHTSELQSLMRISYAVFCLKKKINNTNITTQHNT